MIKDKIKKGCFFIIISFVILILLTNLFNYFAEKIKKKECIENGFCIEQTFYINGILGKNIRNAKVIVYDKKSSFKKIIDSTSILLSDDENPENQTILFKETKVGVSNNYQAKFKKPITTNADWLFVLNDGKRIKISEIETGIGKHRTMFSEVTFCEVKKMKINGVQNDTLITGLSE